MTGPENTIRQGLRDGRLLRGLWLATGSETVTEIAGLAGFDWCLIDAEHAPFDVALIRRQLVTLAATGTPAVVRAPCGEDWVLKQILDIGAQTIMVPMVNSAHEAKAIARACRFPPEGARGNGGATTRASGYGGRADYPAAANAEIAIIVQAETQTALDNLPEIAAVEGVDCVFIGPADLAADMGLRDDIFAPPVRAAITRAVETIRASGKAAGIIVPPALSDRMIEDGVTFLGLDADTHVLTRALRDLAAGAA